MKIEFHRLLIIASLAAVMAVRGDPQPPTLTPKPPPTPRINGPTIFGVRAGSPFLYRIPATGVRPMQFSVRELPEGLRVDPATGQMTGSLRQKGEYKTVLRAKNAAGETEKKFRIVVGDDISLTPAMGWNSWNCWGSRVTAEKVCAAPAAWPLPA